MKTLFHKDNEKVSLYDILDVNIPIVYFVIFPGMTPLLCTFASQFSVLAEEICITVQFTGELIGYWVIKH